MKIHLCFDKIINPGKDLKRYGERTKGSFCPSKNKSKWNGSGFSKQMKIARQQWCWRCSGLFVFHWEGCVADTTGTAMTGRKYKELHLAHSYLVIWKVKQYQEDWFSVSVWHKSPRTTAKQLRGHNALFLDCAFSTVHSFFFSLSCIWNYNSFTILPGVSVHHLCYKARWWMKE